MKAITRYLRRLHNVRIPPQTTNDIVLTFHHLNCANARLKHYMTKSNFSTCTALTVKLTLHLLMPPNTTVHNTFVSFILIAWR